MAFETDEPGDFLDLVQQLRTTRVEQLHAARHADVHLHRRVRRAGAGRARRRRPDLRHRPARDHADHMTDDPKALAADFDEVRDITVIGAGPVGLAAAFWAGMREATLADHRLAAGDRRPAHDALPGEVDLRRRRIPAGPGQGPGRAAARAVARAVRRARAPGHDGRADRLGGRRHRRAAHGRGRPALAHGDHRGRPRRVRAQEAARLRHGPVGGQGRPLPRRREVRVRGQEGADRRRRRLGLRLGRQPARRGRARSRWCTDARASAPTR